MVSNCDMLKQTDLIWTLSIDLFFPKHSVSKIGFSSVCKQAIERAKENVPSQLDLFIRGSLDHWTTKEVLTRVYVSPLSSGRA
jgi:hypothetical protein